MSYFFCTQFVNMFNCINFPSKGEDLSYVSIKLAANLLRMESMSNCGSVISVVCLKCEKF